MHVLLQLCTYTKVPDLHNSRIETSMTDCLASTFELAFKSLPY